MKVNVTLEKSITMPDTYYVVINNVFYIKVKKELWYDLSKHLEINTSESNESTDGFMKLVESVQHNGHVFGVEDTIPTAKITE